MRVFYKEKGNKNVWEETVCRNISGTGICCQINESLQKKAILNIKIELNKDQNILCKGKIVRDDDKGQYGVELFDIKQEFNFFNFICEHLLLKSVE